MAKGDTRHALQVRATEKLVQDVDLIADYLLAKGDVSRIWGDKVSRSAAIEYAIQQLAKSIRFKQANKPVR